MNELVRQIQQGNTSLYIELWESVQNLVAWWANRYYNAITDLGAATGGADVNDLIQCGYFAMVDAVATYDPDKGAAFSSWLGYYVRNEFRKVLGKKDPLDSAISLDVPVSNDDPEGATRLDLVADQRDGIIAAEERIFRDELHEALENALDTLSERQSRAIRAEFFQGRTLEETAQDIKVSISRVAQLRNEGLRKIRHSSNARKLEKFLDDQTNFYIHSGLSSYNHSQTSPVEYLVFHRERLRHMYREE